MRQQWKVIPVNGYWRERPATYEERIRYCTRIIRVWVPPGFVSEKANP